MRCPKCQYISFDSGDRCRNCGYEFVLAGDASADALVDVTIARDEPAPGRLPSAMTALDAPLVGRGADEDREPGRLPTAEDLPLFTERVADDQAPLVTPPAVPRPPLAVRRTVQPPRARHRAPEPEELPLALSGDTNDASDDADAREAAAGGDAAPIARRVAAGLIDVSILAVLLGAVFYLTLRAAGMVASEWRLLPLVPLVAFLLLLCGGYFILFTAAGGQTIGKMMAGIRVVAATPETQGYPRVSFNAAFLRAVACLASVATLGAGFVPALTNADRRTFHDRVADTRVVSA